MSIDSASAGPLQGLRIAVTRPAHQAGPTCEALAAAGAEVLRYPVLEIAAVPEGPPLRAALNALSAGDLAIFISANAVRHGVEWLRDRGGIPAHVQVAAVGRATAAALDAAGVEVDICPSTGFDSEALLSAPALQRVQGATVVLFRGNGGREVLADTLRARGAKVHYAEVYQRVCTQTDVSKLAALWSADRLSLIVVSSGDSLRCLCERAGPDYSTRLLGTPLAVIGERMLQQARSMGFQSEIVVTEPGDQALVAALTDWRRTASHPSPNHE